MAITVAKLLREYRKSGRIGRITPVNAAHAREIAESIIARLQHGQTEKKR